LRWRASKQTDDDWDVGGWFNPDQDPYSVAVSRNGQYLLWVGLKFAHHPAGRRAVGYSVNGGHIDILESVGADPTGTTSLTATVPIRLWAGDRVSVFVDQSSGQTLDVLGHDDKDTSFGLTWISERG
jgi:hypothetical protein